MQWKGLVYSVFVFAVVVVVVVVVVFGLSNFGYWGLPLSSVYSYCLCGLFLKGGWGRRRSEKKEQKGC